MPVRSSSNPTVPGRTVRQNVSTARCKPNGPTGNPSPATTNGPQHLHLGSRTTTLNAVTARSVDSHRSADCNQPDVSVHLGGSDADERWRWGGGRWSRRLLRLGSLGFL